MNTLKLKMALLSGGVMMVGMLAGWAQGGGGTSISASLTFPGNGLASVGVYNDKGELIRTLAYAKPVQTGAQTFAWDGTTDLGLPAAPGAYHVHGVFFTEGPQAKYVMKVGVSGDPPYISDDPNSGWGAMHGPPTAICANSKNLLAIFQVTESARETGIQLMDFNGKIVGRFGGLYTFDDRRACVMDEKNLYVALKVNSYGKKGLMIAKYDLDNPPRGTLLCKLPAGDHMGTSGYWTGKWLAEVDGLALRDGKLYVPLNLDDKICVVSTDGGQIISTADVPSPRGVATFGDAVYALSGTSLVKLDDDGRVDGAPIVTGLDDPSGLAVDAQGNFYISDDGAAQQIKVFTPDGKPLRTIGMKGGRPRDGIYNPAGMLDPRGLCVAPDGKVWVAETADDFQILGSWNQDGTRDKSFYNMHWSSGQGRLSPDHTEMFFGLRSDSMFPGLTAYKIDLEHATWGPSWHLDMTEDAMTHNDVLISYQSLSPRGKVRFPQGEPYLSFERGMMVGTNGKTYLLGGDLSIWLFDPVTKQAKLASLIYCHHVDKTKDGPYQAYYDSGPSNWLTWSDLNGDGKMSLDEVNVAENPPLLDHVPKITNIALFPDLSVLMLAAYSPKNIYVPTHWYVYRMKPTKVLPSGVPVYDWNKLEKVTELQVPDFNGGDNDPNRAIVRVEIDHLHPIGDAIYVNLQPGPKKAPQLKGIDGKGWWASRNWRMTPEKFDLKTGQPAWLKVGRRTSGIAKPGEMYYPGWGLAGRSHGIDFYPDTLGQVWAWTDDGLYLGPVYTRNVGIPVYGPNSLFVELTGAFVYDINGKTYITAGDHGIFVHELTLPTLTPVDGGPVTLTPAQAAQAQPWDPDAS